MQKAGIAVASGWYGKGRRGVNRQGKQVGRNHGYSEVEVRTTGFLPTCRECSSM